MTWMSRALRLGLILTTAVLLLPLGVLLATSSCLLLLLASPVLLKPLGLLPAASLYGFWRFSLWAHTADQQPCPRPVLLLVTLTNLLAGMALVLGCFHVLPLTPLLNWYLASPLLLTAALMLSKSGRRQVNTDCTTALPLNAAKRWRRWFAAAWLIVIALLIAIAGLGSLATHGIEGLARTFLPTEWQNWVLIFVLVAPATRALLPPPRQPSQAGIPT